jgi:hypothetical protein
MSTQQPRGFEVITQGDSRERLPTYRRTGTCMMRRSSWGSPECAPRHFLKGVGALLAGCAALLSVVSLPAEANAQEIQLTGPLAGAPAVRQLRLHRAGRFEVSLGSSFTLLDQYLRTAMPGGTLTYHFTDWLGIGVFGGYGFQYSTGLADELQGVVTGYNCNTRPWTQACQLTGVNLTRGSLINDQFAHMTWMVAPQVVAVPFRGKLSLFSALFVDADVDFFAGAAFVGLKERAECGHDDNGNAIQACNDYTNPNSPPFSLASRVAIAPTFGLGLNFYPASQDTNFFGIGFEFRAFPFAWNTSGFDNHGGGSNGSFPDNNVNAADREFHFNTMATIQLKFAFPVSIKSSQ